MCQSEFLPLSERMGPLVRQIEDPVLRRDINDMLFRDYLRSRGPGSL